MNNKWVWLCLWAVALTVLVSRPTDAFIGGHTVSIHLQKGLSHHGPCCGKKKKKHFILKMVDPKVIAGKILKFKLKIIGGLAKSAMGVPVSMPLGHAMGHYIMGHGCCHEDHHGHRKK